jgi:hypothetical protein
MMKSKRFLPMLALASVVSSSIAMPAAMAHNDRYYNNYDYRGYTRYENNRRPYLKKAAIGAGAGALVGGLVLGDGSTMDGAVKGALLGAGAGLGYEYLRRKGYFSGNRW